MDLLIKGLKMPNSCQTCVYELGYNIPMCPDDAILENYLEDERLGRHPSCPLVEIPPHGELIDKQEALKGLIIAMDCVSCRHPDDCSWCSVNEWQDVIRNAPTVLEATK